MRAFFFEMYRLDVPRMQCSRPLLRRDALLIRGPSDAPKMSVPALRCNAEEALHRVRDMMYLTAVIARSVSDEAIQTMVLRRSGLLCFVRNDGTDIL